MPKLLNPPDPSDPEYQKLELSVNFYLHLAIYSACMTCMWFIQSITEKVWIWSIWVAVIWGILILGHGIWVLTQEKLIQKA
jgi:hypothetical protein